MLPLCGVPAAVFWSWNKGQSWNNINLPPNAFPNPAYNRWGNIATYQSSHDNCVALRAVQNSVSPFGVHKQLVLYGGGNTIAVNANPAPSCVQTLYVTVAYAELMFPQEQTTAFVNTLATAVPSGVNVPNAAFNSPSPLLTYRSYPTCAYDVHSIPSHPSAPNQYYLGGWDSNGTRRTATVPSVLLSQASHPCCGLCAAAVCCQAMCWRPSI